MGTGKEGKAMRMEPVEFISQEAQLGKKKKNEQANKTKNKHLSFYRLRIEKETGLLFSSLSSLDWGKLTQ